MTQYREIIRMAAAGIFNQREIAESLRLSRNTVSRTLKKAKESDLTWTRIDADELNGYIYPNQTLRNSGIDILPVKVRELSRQNPRQFRRWLQDRIGNNRPRLTHRYNSGDFFRITWDSDLISHISAPVLLHLHGEIPVFVPLHRWQSERHGVRARLGVES